MRTLKSLAIVLSLGLFLFATSARADEWNKLTQITFSGPVQVANTNLPAGTYTFKLLDERSDRNIVQIFNADQTHLIATVLAMPDYRLKPTGNTAVKFAETSEGTQAEGNVPESGLPLKEWFYPGDSYGQEFRVVPKQVAAVQPEPAPVAAETPAPAPAAEPATQPAPAPAPQEAAPTPQAAPAPTANTDDQTTSTSNQQSDPDKLPKTASDMPLVAAIGFLALAAAVSLRVLLKATA
jgi:outer membrane biosynthesis protein TonB